MLNHKGETPMARSKTKPIETKQPTIRVIKKTACPALSGKSELIYCLGNDPDSQLMIRIYSNTGGGFFSDEWLSVADILDTLDSWDSDKHITSIALNGLFQGRSVNTSAFLMAALKAEGVLEAVEGKQRCHQLGDVEAFLGRAKQLQSGKAPRKAAVRKKAPAKRKPTPRAKKKTA
jgi:hypothetical protein